ncbi:hypothetical protein MCU_01422 [Bartonella elizabethae Re6043vi]|uniref:Uncharacterized protein n=2 Tax=Bartonella elizabethae TaxID=807 RepID=J1K865_BAREL|nr:hypothetical protein [Bartonella elizabethae]EJF82540.1 hypothetical protein MCU_01422 [Bartonella elizabethae Re6043vi]EJF93515.1 hypothetical protein MEE_01461 [Bartonella elizabethae F9251 = ATCC 49927]VEJ41876.1 Uncharacterised protein [Bartonella elizabethae]
MQEKNATFEESFFSGKKLTVSLGASCKGVSRCKMIGRSFFIMFCTIFYTGVCRVFYTGLIMMALEVPAGAKSLVQPEQWARWEAMGSLIFLLPVLIWFCLLTPLPILWGVDRFKERKLKKIRQKLEEETKLLKINR